MAPPRDRAAGGSDATATRQIVDTLELLSHFQRLLGEQLRPLLGNQEALERRLEKLEDNVLDLVKEVRGSHSSETVLSAPVPRGFAVELGPWSSGAIVVVILALILALVGKADRIPETIKPYVPAVSAPAGGP